jgi:hypothetical protein
MQTVNNVVVFMVAIGLQQVGGWVGKWGDFVLGGCVVVFGLVWKYRVYFVYWVFGVVSYYAHGVRDDYVGAYG